MVALEQRGADLGGVEGGFLVIKQKKWMATPGQTLIT